MDETRLSLSFETGRALLRDIDPTSVLVSLRPMGAEGTHPAFVIEARTASGAPLHLAVKCYRNDLGSGNRRAQVEFKTLQLLQQHAVPVPAPLYLDAEGTIVGMPTIVTSFVTGQQLFALDDPLHAAQELAKVLLQIHQVPVSAVEQAWLEDANHEVFWFRKQGMMPAYMVQHPDGWLVWERVEQLLAQWQPAPPTFVHTDYWIGQVLWNQGRIAAVLDWEEAGYGDPGYDVAYCYLDLALGPMGRVAAAELLNVYVGETGRPIANLDLWQWAVIPRVLHNAEWVNTCRQQLQGYIADLRSSKP